GARLETLDATVGASLALGEDHHHLPGLEEPDGLARRPWVGRLDLDGKRAEQTDEWPEEGDLEETAPCRVVDAPTDRNRNERRIGVRLGVRRDDQGSRRRNVLNADQLEAEAGPAEGDAPGAEQAQQGRAPPSSVIDERKGCREAPRPHSSGGVVTPQLAGPARAAS